MIVIHYAVRPFASSRHVGYITEFAKRVPTVFVDPEPQQIRPTGPLDTWSRPLPELSAPPPAAGLHVVRTGSIVPFGRYRPITAINRRAGLRRIIRKLRKEFPGEPIVCVVLRPDHITDFKRIPADLRVYEMRDDYVAQAASAEDAERMQRLHESALNRADVVVAISDAIVESVRPIRPDCILIPTGVEYEMFSSASADRAPESLRAVPHPRVGLVGNLNDRVDWELIGTLAERLPEVSIVLVGSLYNASPEAHARFEELVQKKNVYAIGRLPHDQLPAATAALDVGMIPYRITAKVERINPLKFLQYLAAGKPVVTTPIPCIADQHMIASIESNPLRFVEAVREACENPDEPDRVEMRRRYARRHDWGEIVEEALSTYRAALSQLA
jgi:glycosyltransferase involved in cell wall biosynthesis